MDLETRRQYFTFQPIAITSLFFISLLRLHSELFCFSDSVCKNTSNILQPT